MLFMLLLLLSLHPYSAFVYGLDTFEFAIYSIKTERDK